jgi:hypothetical protein
MRTSHANRSVPSTHLSEKLDVCIRKLGFPPPTSSDRDYISLKINSAIEKRAASANARRANRQENSEAQAALEILDSSCQNILETISALYDYMQSAPKKLEAGNTLERSLSEINEVGTIDEARRVIEGFVNAAAQIAAAARTAKSRLVPERLRTGPKRHWHDDFTSAVMRICALNSIPTTIVTDPISRQSRGRFLEVASALEEILPVAMRAPSIGALAKRLGRSQRRNKIRFAHPLLKHLWGPPVYHFSQPNFLAKCGRRLGKGITFAADRGAVGVSGFKSRKKTARRYPGVIRLYGDCGVEYS